MLGGWFGLGGCVCVCVGVAMVVSFCMAWASVLLAVAGGECSWYAMLLSVRGW